MLVGSMKTWKWKTFRKIKSDKQHTISFADDSAIARKQITQTLYHMGVKYIQNVYGANACDALDKMATRCQEDGTDITDEIQLVLADVEMPEMDGYVGHKKLNQVHV